MNSRDSFPFFSIPFSAPGGSLRVRKIEFGFRFDLVVLTKTIAKSLNQLTALLTEPFKTMFYHFMRTTCLAVLLSLVVPASAAELPEGVRRIKVLNYADCFELSNAQTRVTLCHQAGG